MNILTQEDLQNLDLALDTIRELRVEVKRATQAGIPVTVTLEDLAAQEKQILAIKRAYFPQGGAGGG